MVLEEPASPGGRWRDSATPSSETCSTLPCRRRPGFAFIVGSARRSRPSMTIIRSHRPLAELAHHFTWPLRPAKRRSSTRAERLSGKRWSYLPPRRVGPALSACARGRRAKGDGTLPPPRTRRGAQMKKGTTLSTKSTKKVENFRNHSGLGAPTSPGRWGAVASSSDNRARSGSTRSHRRWSVSPRRTSASI